MEQEEGALLLLLPPDVLRHIAGKGINLSRTS
jgi:hypothetical protein